MTSNVIGEGRWDAPPPETEWEPAEKHVPHLLGELMYMGSIDEAGTIIRQYKHCFTRRYINLDDTGQAWWVEYREVGSPWDRGVERDWEMSATRITLAEAEQALGLDPRGYADL